jgi:hypothetical protein
MASKLSWVWFNLEIESYLLFRPHLKKIMKWRDPNGKIRAYKNWTSEEKRKLSEFYNKIKKGESTGLPDAPARFEEYRIITLMKEATAKDYYLAWLANSLYLDIHRIVNWKLSDFNAEDLALILDGCAQYSWYDYKGDYLFSDITGAVNPGCPVRIRNFLFENHLWNPRFVTIKNAITKLLDWSRRLIHFRGGATIENCEDHWQYRGWPPIERVLNGTYRTSDNKFANWTAGCGGTSGLFHWCLKSINIPSKMVKPTGHCHPYFVSEHAALSHGDDPYALRVWDPEKSIPVEELFISQEIFHKWFEDPALSDEEKIKNVGKQVSILAIKYLPLGLLRLYCRDKIENKSHSEGGVYRNLQNHYRLEELEKIRLWEKMDEKINQLGGCEAIYP